MRLFLVFIIFPSFIYAQSAYLNNPDIVWAAEVENDWQFDVLDMSQEWQAGHETTKLLQTPQNESYWKSPYFVSLVFHATTAHKLPIFSDAQCLIPMSYDMYASIVDTFVTFDPETYEKKINLKKRIEDPLTDVKGWRLRQILYYNKKTATWHTKQLAIAPLIENIPGAKDSLSVYFWFKVFDGPEKLTDNHVVWAKKTVSDRNPRSNIMLQGNKMIKVTDGFQEPMYHYMDVFAKNMKRPYYSGYDENILLSEKDREEMLVMTDTFVVYDPLTFEESVAVARATINVEHLQSIRLLQHWYWDERKSRLFIHLEGVAPLKNIYDDVGHFRFVRPLFYQYTKPQKKAD